MSEKSSLVCYKVRPDLGFSSSMSKQCLNKGSSGNEYTLVSLRNTQPQSSQLAEPLWTDPDLKSRISVRELISSYIKKKKKLREKKSAGWEWMVELSPQNLRKRGKIHHHQCVPKVWKKVHQLVHSKEGLNESSPVCVSKPTGPEWRSARVALITDSTCNHTRWP